MVQPGYQDWGRYGIPSADNIFSASVPVTPNYNGPASDCSSWTSIILEVDWQDPAAIIQGTVAWTGFTSTLENITVDTFVLGPNQFLSMALPTKGRTVALGWSVISGTQTLASRYGIIGLSHPTSKYDAKQDYRFIVDDSRAYGAGANVVLPTNYWYEGKVQVSLASSAGNAAVASFQYWDSGAFAFKEFASVAIQTQTSAMPLTLMFPPAPVRVQVFNFGAVQTINVEVIPTFTG